MFCEACGNPISAEDVFCPVCGKKASSVPDVKKQIEDRPYIENYIPGMDYNPIGMWGYFGYSILFGIPILGFIMTLVFALGGTRNINLRNYARSMFCLDIIIGVIAFTVFIVSSGFIASLF